MTTLTTTQKRIDVNFTPLRTSGAIEVVGSVPDRQIWSADTGEFTPDYTLTPLVLFPRCNATAPDQYIKSGAVNAGLTNMKWYEIQGTQRTRIEEGNANYEITTEGDTKGRIKVKRNSSNVTPLGLEFYAEYVDTRTGQTCVFRLSTVVPVSDATVPAPVLTLDSPATVVWNPLRQGTRRTFTARVMAGDKDVATSEHTKLFWYRRLDTGALEAITDGNGENDWEVEAVDGPTLTVDLDYIGSEMTYVCRAAYTPEGTPPDAPRAADPAVTTTIRRRIPAVEADWKGAPSGVPGDTTTIRPEAVVRDTMGIIPNADTWLKFLWLTKKKGGSSYAQAAEGMKPTIPFSEGMMLRLDVEDKGPLAVVVDEDGSYLVDEDDSFLFQRENE